MIILDAAELAQHLPYAELVNVLEEAFTRDIKTPLRQHHTVHIPDGEDGQLLLMPAWEEGNQIGVKLVTVFPGNAQKGMASINAGYVIFDGKTGQLRAQLDGTELTLRRTAAASALASRYLSRKDAGYLLMVGSGKLAPHLISAHTTVRPIMKVQIWGRCYERACAVVEYFSDTDLEIEAINDLEAGVSRADIISCATMSKEPLVSGKWLKQGQHLDLVGAYKPDMREADSEALQRADIYVDTRDGAMNEAGEIVQGLQSGIIRESHIKGDLFGLCRGHCPGRRTDDEITLFKSVGTALEDLAAAQMVLKRARADFT